MVLAMWSSIVFDDTTEVEFKASFINGLNALADNQDNVGLTKRINGGTIGLDDRTNRFNNNLIALSQ